ncbi:MAG: cysteine desulfurase / selenocysteine lyase, partial [Acidimicrobiaceae bacterium]
MAALDVARIKKDFPLLQQQIDGHRIVYLDSGASSEKPQAVLDAMDEVYTTYYANVHRSVYKIAAEATERYEEARGKIARFINAPSTNNIV